MQPVKTDRRSQRTRNLLSKALMALMLEKRYDRITVQDIIDRANIGRSTFYLHFQDKEDLLVTHFEEVLDTFSQHLVHSQGSGRPFMSVAALFRHAQEFHSFYAALFWGRGIELLYKQGQLHMSRRIEANLATLVPPNQPLSIPLPILSNHIAGTLTTLIRWWLENKMPYPAEKMDDIFQQLIQPTIDAAMGSRS